MSQPSVSTAQLVTSSVSPDARRASTASRSGFGVEPSICSAFTPDLMNSSRMWTEWATLTAKQTVFAPVAVLVPMGDDVADQIGTVHALGELVLDVIADAGFDALEVNIARRIDRAS